METNYITQTIARCVNTADKQTDRQTHANTKRNASKLYETELAHNAYRYTDSMLKIVLLLGMALSTIVLNQKSN